jgi:hypothetical protein
MPIVSDRWQFKILKRTNTPPAANPTTPANTNSTQQQPQTAASNERLKDAKSLEEREREYAEARQRIFGNDDDGTAN